MNKWYQKHWAEKETPEFYEWWEDWYGESDESSDDKYDTDEYWMRKGFALAGWLEARYLQ